MDVMSLNKARPDMRRRQRSEADAEDDATEMEAAPATAADLYGVLGYRAVGSSVTTQQCCRCAVSVSRPPQPHSIV